MCGRFALDLDPEVVRQDFEERNVPLNNDELSVPDFTRNYNVGPTQPAPVYHDSKLHIMKWGLIPFWTKDVKKATPWRTFNARAETLCESRLWKPSLNHKRCVVPISGYYEWLTEKGQKIPYFIRRKDKKVMFLAGLFDMMKLGKQNDGDKDEELWTFTVITGPAPDNLRWLHERMPMVLEPGSKEWDAWLDQEKDQWTQEEIDTKLKPICNEAEYEWYKVPQEVGKVQNNERRLMEPIKKTGKLDAFFKKEAKSAVSDQKPIHVKRESSEPDSAKENPVAKRVKHEAH